ncbi:hypothetical protein EV363DRAFT_1150227 [Boletus edulis]|nr:hypothetical protein EV363DRAFT_1150227 [Boletus edulis]
MHQSFHVNNALQGVSTLAVVTTGLHAIPAPTCGLASGLHCTLPLDGSTKSIKLHLRKHGHWHSQRQVVQCPWTGCPAILRWMNIPRHIQSIHLGVRFRCFNCGKAYTRPEGLAVHTASLKCYGMCISAWKGSTHRYILFRRYCNTCRGVEDRGESTWLRPHGTWTDIYFLLFVVVMHVYYAKMDC